MKLTCLVSCVDQAFGDVCCVCVTSQRMIILTVCCRAAVSNH